MLAYWKCKACGLLYTSQYNTKCIACSFIFKSKQILPQTKYHQITDKENKSSNNNLQTRSNKINDQRLIEIFGRPYRNKLISLQNDTSNLYPSNAWLMDIPLYYQSIIKLPNLCDGVYDY